MGSVWFETARGCASVSLAMAWLMLASRAAAVSGLESAGAAETDTVWVSASPGVARRPRTTQKRVTGQHLDANPGWALGINAYAGLAVLGTSPGGRAHTLIGGVARARIGYVQLGGSYEVTNDTGDSWQQAGGFLGAFVPYTNWFDLEAQLGVAYRTHVDPDDRYGPSGYRLGGPALTLRLGVSDRAPESSWAARLGGELFCALDLKQRDVSWRYDLGPNRPPVTGTTRVGGFSIGMGITLGFELAPGSRGGH